MNWLLVLPEFVLALSAMGILMVGAFRKDDAGFTAAMLALGAMLVCGMLVLGTPAGTGFNGMWVNDAFSSFCKILILVAAALALIVAIDFNARQGIGRYEFAVLLLLSVTGTLVMVSASNLMILYLGFELMSLALYVVAAFDRDAVRSSEAGLKYFVLGALASGLLLYGISLTYGFAGTTSFDAIAQVLANTPSTGLVVGVVFVIAGLSFKIRAVPFHMWTPDVYEGSPTPVTALFSTVPKVATLALLMRVLFGPFGAMLAQWQTLILLISIASMVLGALAAISQTNIKRMMAYSSISHIGYALMGLAAGTENGVRGTLLYLAIYVAMNAGAFACIVAMRRRGMAVEMIRDLAGLGRTDSLMAAGFAVFMFSMAAIPLLAGFFAKLYVFLAVVEQGMWTLAIIGVLTSVLGAYYYLNIVKVMYFDSLTDEPLERRAGGVSLVLAGTGVFNILFFALPAPLVAAAGAAARALFG